MAFARDPRRSLGIQRQDRQKPQVVTRLPVAAGGRKAPVVATAGRSNTQAKAWLKRIPARGPAPTTKPAAETRRANEFAAASSPPKGQAQGQPHADTTSKTVEVEVQGVDPQPAAPVEALHRQLPAGIALPNTTAGSVNTTACLSNTVSRGEKAEHAPQAAAVRTSKRVQTAEEEYWPFGKPGCGAPRASFATQVPQYQTTAPASKTGTAMANAAVTPSPQKGQDVSPTVRTEPDSSREPRLPNVGHHRQSLITNQPRQPAPDGFQDALRQQVEDRKRQKQLERERWERQEQEDNDRVYREQEELSSRFDDEKRKREEKQRLALVSSARAKVLATQVEELKGQGIVRELQNIPRTPPGQVNPNPNPNRHVPSQGQNATAMPAFVAHTRQDGTYMNSNSSTVVSRDVANVERPLRPSRIPVLKPAMKHTPTNKLPARVDPWDDRTPNSNTVRNTKVALKGKVSDYSSSRMPVKQTPRNKLAARADPWDDRIPAAIRNNMAAPESKVDRYSSLRMSRITENALTHYHEENSIPGPDDQKMSDVELPSRVEFVPVPLTRDCARSALALDLPSPGGAVAEERNQMCMRDVGQAMHLLNQAKQRLVSLGTNSEHRIERDLKSAERFFGRRRQFLLHGK